MCEPRDDVVGVVGINPMNVIEPGLGFGCIAEFDYRRAIEVEDRYVFALVPSARGYEAVADEHWFSWCPGHLLDRLFAVEPSGGGNGDGIAPAVGSDLDRGYACVDAACWPVVACRRVDIIV